MDECAEEEDGGWAGSWGGIKGCNGGIHGREKGGGGSTCLMYCAILPIFLP
jgi:hypothetical protein